MTPKEKRAYWLSMSEDPDTVMESGKYCRDCGRPTCMSVIESRCGSVSFFSSEGAQTAKVIDGVARFERCLSCRYFRPAKDYTLDEFADCWEICCLLMEC